MEVLVLLAVLVFLVLPVVAGVLIRMVGWALYGYFGAKLLMRLKARRERNDGAGG